MGILDFGCSFFKKYSIFNTQFSIFNRNPALKGRNIKAMAVRPSLREAGEKMLKLGILAAEPGILPGKPKTFA
jgi:hypothetical protein